MQGWKETPAKIVRAKLETHRGSKGGTTYEATAEYTYQYGSRQYTGNRVGIQGGSDNFGSFQQNVHRQLSEHQKSGRPFRCYVNPERPAEAILFRDLRWEMVGLSDAIRDWRSARWVLECWHSPCSAFARQRQQRAGRSPPRRTLVVQEGMGRRENQFLRQDRRDRLVGRSPSFGT